VKIRKQHLNSEMRKLNSRQWYIVMMDQFPESYKRIISNSREYLKGIDTKHLRDVCLDLSYESCSCCAVKIGAKEVYLYSVEDYILICANCYKFAGIAHKFNIDYIYAGLAKNHGQIKSERYSMRRKLASLIVEGAKIEEGATGMICNVCDPEGVNIHNNISRIRDEYVICDNCAKKVWRCVALISVSK
jgi:hypothetical protein